MRQFLRRIGPRTGISFGLVLIVGTIVIVARMAGGAPQQEPHQVQPDPRPSVAATVGDDAAVAPTPSAYADDAALRITASTFVSAWLRRTIPAADWLDGLRPVSTPRLIGLLTGVDPLEVPVVQAGGSLSSCYEPTFTDRCGSRSTPRRFCWGWSSRATCGSSMHWTGIAVDARDCGSGYRPASQAGNSALDRGHRDGYCDRGGVHCGHHDHTARWATR